MHTIFLRPIFGIIKSKKKIKKIHILTEIKHNKGIKFFKENKMNKKISDIMTFDVFTLEQDNTILDAALIMKENDIGFIPIVNNKKVIGVVTDRDLVVRGYAQGFSENTPVIKIMTSSCITVEKDALIDDVADIMSKNKIRRLCVLDKDELVGVCAIGDISVCNDGKTEAGIALSKISEPSNDYITN